MIRPRNRERLAPAAADRERIEAAAFDLMLERGYAETTVDAVCERAGVTAEQFHRHYQDLQAWVAVAYTQINDEFDCRVQAAHDAQEGWRDSLRAAAYAAADFFAEHPREVRFGTVAIAEAGEMVAARRDANLQHFVDLIDAGRQELPEPDSLSRSVAESVIGAIFERLMKDAGRGGVGHARTLVPELMYLAVRPYFGHDEARKELSAPPPFPPGGGPQGRAKTSTGADETACAKGELGEVGLLAVTRRSEPPDEEAARLARLPPGRHGLSRDFVVQNQRDRLAAGMIAAVAEKGYRDATVSDVSAAAGVSRRTFYGYFSSKEDCYLATYEIVARHLAEASLAAGAGERSWARRVRAEIAGAMQLFSANPDLVRFYLQAPPRAGEEVAARYRQGAKMVLAQLGEGAPAKARKPNPDVLNAIAGGMAALIVRKVEVGEGERLDELVPDLTELFLSPYIGRKAAARTARS